MVRTWFFDHEIVGPRLCVSFVWCFFSTNLNSLAIGWLCLTLFVLEDLAILHKGKYTTWLTKIPPSSCTGPTTPKSTIQHNVVFRWVCLSISEGKNMTWNIELTRKKIVPIKLLSRHLNAAATGNLIRAHICLSAPSPSVCLIVLKHTGLKP